MGKSEKNQFNKYVQKIACGPGPAAYDALNSLKSVCLKNKPKF